jgi:hypothetical protein
MNEPLTHETIRVAIDALAGVGAQPTMLIVHPRTAWRLRLWTRWWRTMESRLTYHYRWPRWLTVRIWRRRRRLADEHFQRWMTRQTYWPTKVPGVMVNPWVPEDAAYKFAGPHDG